MKRETINQAFQKIEAGKKFLKFRFPQPFRSKGNIYHINMGWCLRHPMAGPDENVNQHTPDVETVKWKWNNPEDFKDAPRITGADILSHVEICSGCFGTGRLNRSFDCNCFMGFETASPIRIGEAVFNPTSLLFIIDTFGPIRIIPPTHDKDPLFFNFWEYGVGIIMPVSDWDIFETEEDLSN